MNRPLDLLRSTSRAYRWLTTASFAVLIVVLSVTPDAYQSGDNVFRWLVANTYTPIQKALHVVTYALLAGLLYWALDKLASRRTQLILALVIAVLFGTALEWYQLFVPGRFGTLYDIILNSAGAIVGLSVAKPLIK